jgi:nitrite reductase (NADH) small subunit
MDERVKVGECRQFPRGEGRKCLLGGEEIGIFNLGDEFRAVSNACPHQGGPLSDGLVLGTEVVCPMHSRKIDLKTGMVAKENGKTQTFEVEIRNGEIYLKH